VNGWKKMREKVHEQYEKEFAQGTVDKTCVKAAMHGQMEEALCGFDKCSLGTWL
jgi:hypothetical protein